MKTSKILLPLATLVAAGAIAVGSGATFTSTSSNTISSVTSGKLEQTNSKDEAAIFNASDIKPGDAVTGSLTITNSGTLPADFSLTETDAVNGFGDKLTMVVTKTGTTTPVYTGTFDKLAKTGLGEVAPNAANEYTFTVSLDKTAGDTLQGQTASAAFTWDSVQKNAG
ncbi:TasA family protein [Aeromicrobium chenweiae]|uniref:Uncharacterized protein n=1 Tax=Aeromicrobium chenweiae TaxID=2079793 RepID=A0A2S0WIQ7_9ACTN|nr:TasA family protein [Aeromicrobium chenweiae]AWB91172.1 hypothetical protein C3E78_02445 [Aeromicrobium chenweiae]TGN31691.1 hypothetical protein E4L97_11955 [Aeromicrobium chenweiae]